MKFIQYLSTPEEISVNLVKDPKDRSQTENNRFQNKTELKKFLHGKTFDGSF